MSNNSKVLVINLPCKRLHKNMFNKIVLNGYLTRRNPYFSTFTVLKSTL